MRNFAKTGFLLAAMTASSWALGDGCMNERLPRDEEYKLMHACIQNKCAMSSADFEAKVDACACYIGALICELGEKELLREDHSQTCHILKKKERVEKCLEKKKK